MKQVLKGLQNGAFLPNIEHFDVNKDVQVVDGYRSKAHGLVLNTIIKNVSTSDDNYIAETTHWFYIPKESKDSSAQFLGKGMGAI
jgi:hypothetical protein